VRIRKEKPAQTVSPVKPMTLNLQTRAFAPIDAEDSTPVKAQNKSSGYKYNPADDLSLKLINSPMISRSPINNVVQRHTREHFAKVSAKKELASMQIQAKLNIGEPNDKYEKEADDTAAKVVQQINSSSQGGSVQKQESMESEDDELQMKPAISKIQRQESMEDEEELQAKSLVQRRENLNGGEASTDLESSIQSARGSGQSLDPKLQEKMSQAMGADFSGVKVHTDSQSDQLNQSIQAKAFTTGQDVFFRQGAYEPSSRGGQELIAHELTHVVQQTSGRKVVHNYSESNKIIRRKPLGRNDLKGKVSTKADLNKQRGKESTFSEIIKYLGNYEDATNSRDELRFLQALEMLVNEWKVAHGDGETKKEKTKAVSLSNILTKVHAALANLGDEQQSQYGEKIANTNQAIAYDGATSKSFKHMTESGARGAVTEGANFAKARKNAESTGLTDEELAAIRIYSGGDYRYINPTLNKNKGWLEGESLNLTGLGAKKETKWANSGTLKQMLEQQGKLTKQQERVLKIEAMQHARVAITGLEKLPDNKVSGYRGMTITKDALDAEYKANNVVTWAGFSSCSTDQMVSSVYANQPAEGKVGLLITLNIKHGKDISTFSQEAAEKEILVLPGAKFKVAGVPTTQNNKLYRVTLDQTEAGSLAGVPPNTKPKPADQTGTLAAPAAVTGVTKDNISGGLQVAAPQRPKTQLDDQYRLKVEAREAAKHFIAVAKDDAIMVKSKLKSIANEFKGSLEGLQYQFKTEDSLTRKLIDRVKTRITKGSSDSIDKLLKEESEGMNDVLRFTLKIPDKKYKEAYDAMKNRMKEYPPVPDKEWNGWTDYRGIYKGINMTFKTKNVGGNLFEVQLHTDESLIAKEEIHPMYEERRASDTTDSRRQELDKQMKARWAKVPKPKGF
jgi:Domain of unknown function (DUF4157)